MLKRLQRGISVMVDEVRPQILELEQQTETVNTVEEAQSLHMAYMSTAQHYVGLCQKLEEYAIEVQVLKHHIVGVTFTGAKAARSVAHQQRSCCFMSQQYEASADMGRVNGRYVL